HRKDDAGENLKAQHEGQNAAEGPPVIQVLGRREVEHLRVDEFHNGKPLMQPSSRGAFRLVAGMTGHAARPSYPIRTLVSEIYSYLGTGRFCGAGPLRMRPAV